MAHIETNGTTAPTRQTTRRERRRFKRVNVKPTTTKQPETKFGIYPAYHFIDHDPIIDQVDTLMNRSGMKLAAIANASHVAPQTLRNWELRKTKRPQFATIKAVVNSLGGSLVIVYKGRKIGE